MPLDELPKYQLFCARSWAKTEVQQQIKNKKEFLIIDNLEILEFILCVAHSTYTFNLSSQNLKRLTPAKVYILPENIVK